jgi:hypothetical protein
MTFSKRFGFLEQGKDVNGMLASAENVMRYFSVVRLTPCRRPFYPHSPWSLHPLKIGQMPTLDKWLGKNPYCPIKFADFSGPANFCVQRFMERMQNLEAFKGKRDYMNGFLAAKREYPDLVSDANVLGYLIVNVRLPSYACLLRH